VAENVKTLLTRLFVDHWQRKLISLILAIIIWLMIEHSMTITKQIDSIPVRVTHLPQEKTIEGMQCNGILNKRISLTITGNKTAVEELTGKDLEVVIDATDKPDQWIAAISKKNLVSLKSEFDVSTMISKIHPFEMIIKQSKLVTEKIPITITHPIGKAPKGYQFLDIWPYQLCVTINGPEEAIKRLKNRGPILTFNLSDISATELDTLTSKKSGDTGDAISFFVPNSWKKINLPFLSDTPIEIDDPQAKNLRIDFSRQEFLPIEIPLPITVFFPPKHSHTINPETCALALNDFVAKKNGIQMITMPLYAQGVSRLFLETVKDMIQIVVVAAPKQEREKLLWNVQFMYPNELEDRYVAKVLSESTEEISDVHPHLREDYLRNRFRSYMTRFRLYSTKQSKLLLNIELQGDSIAVTSE
jgi:hypothetical protein